MLSAILCTVFVSLVTATKNEVVLQLKPETLISTLQALKSSGYFQKLADEFALKAAEQFIKQLKKEKNTATRERLDESPKVPQHQPSKTLQSEQNTKKLRKASGSHRLVLADKVPIDDGKKEMKTKSKLKTSDRASSEERRSEQVLMSLMDTPPPDGDNLENESVLTEVEEKKTEKPLGLYKINGKHFRRYDFFWK
ncbi:uncharacterized protein LOC125226369 isoform X2 [Leguminivora glycinivorella]|uniref:uncharacterized protein LOC125226369 isoform X2 n=1 Tax=Leguminivora glycinivorella TaxID=1035111 RepID=UPI00200CC3ED|nr:uncharacterized protein LOC125226369 isoform X2 [Leguminivora glycinivorella]